MKSLLSKMIDQKGISKNNLIREIGVDRSTFYKLINGKRTPTKEQFCLILLQMDLSTEEKLQLIEEYEFRRYWKPEEEFSLKIVREFLRFLNRFSCENWREDQSITREAVEERQAVPKEILELVDREQACVSTQQTIRALISEEMLKKYDWHDLFLQMKDLSERMSISILLIPGSQKQYNVIQKIKNVELYFELVEQTGLEINVYRDRYLTDKVLSDPYPYWIIGTESMIRISEDLEDYVLIDKSSVIKRHVQDYTRRVILAYRILKKYNQLGNIVQEMSEKCMVAIDEGKRMYVMSAIPCTTLSVSDSQIRKYCPEGVADLICHYHYLISEAANSEFVTLSGYETMRKNRTITEWNMDMMYSEQDMAIIEENIQDRLKSGKLFVLSELSGCVPERYSIAMFENKEINVQSLSDPSRVIQIREKLLVNAMQKWFEYRDDIAWIEEQLGLIREL